VTKEEQENKILQMILDDNKYVRYAAICDAEGKILCDKRAKNKENLLTLEETKTLLKTALDRWRKRYELADKIGKGEYSVVSYEKIKRITVPLGKDRLLFVSVDGGKNVRMKDIMEIVDYVSHKFVPLSPPK
jgi:hypothetical protein